MSDADRRRVIGSWNPYAGDGRPLVEEIARDFARLFGHLKGLTIYPGIGLYHGGEYIIGALHKLVFDRRLLPDKHLGLRVHAGVADIPDDFRVFKGYVWAPENFEHLVDSRPEEVRSELGHPDMSREEMLHALCGMEFDKWVATCRRWGPGHTNK